MELRHSISSNQIGEICLGDSYSGSKEDIQIALAPHIQTYLSQNRRRQSCCSVMLPVAFERAAHRSWFDPKFDSVVLEEQFKTSVYPQIRLRFRFALAYIIFCCLIWLLYFIFGGEHTTDSSLIICGSLVLLLLSSSTGLWLTYTKYYRINSYAISLAVALSISITSLTFLWLAFTKFSPLGHFAICLEIIFIIYTVIPLPLWQCSCITIVYSICFEILTSYMQRAIDMAPTILTTLSPMNDVDGGKTAALSFKLVSIRVLLQVCIHIIGAHVLIMNVVRMRGTFMKVGQNLLVRRQLEMEKQLKEKMIHSVMPPKVADMLLKEGGATLASDMERRSNDWNSRPLSHDVKTLFRPFHMHSMNNVSILFADIVGFTKMSSTKTAEQLVEILNDLFERFDDLCEASGCEKISTLGDCYYCVSGCPEPRPDHAICCVEMGLGMIKTMQIFDSYRHEGVQIRVGVHTGTVLCGIVGTRRVKFDVWSNDVTLANRMESTGRPEEVHISQETSNFLGDIYELEEGDEVFGHRTYFVSGRKKESPKNSSLCLPETSGGSEKLSQSTLMLPELSVPPTSPVGHLNTVSAGPSPILSFRPRLASLGKVSKFLSSKKHSESKIHNTVPKPQIIVTAKSLPGSLNEDNGDEICDNHKPLKNITKDEKTSSFWKVPKFLRKTDNSTTTIDGKLDTSQPPPLPKCDGIELNGYCQIPVVIETNQNQQRTTNNTLMVPKQVSIAISPSPKDNHNQNHHYDGGGLGGGGGGSGGLGGGLSPNAHFSMFDDIIDVRSYISQSRSDISPFARTGSYRSTSGRSPINYDDPTSLTRPRSSTITSQFLTVDNNNDNQRNLLGSALMGGSDGLSISPTIASRKDSGIRSNSRRSSIQHQIFATNQASQNRVSGYFTSSQSSLSNIPNAIEIQTMPYIDPLAACLQQLRKQSDLQLIKCVRDNAKSQRNYLVKPPISPITLFFKSHDMERNFRGKAHRFGGGTSSCDMDGLSTLATPKYNTFLDIFVGIIFFVCISCSLFLLIPTTNDVSYHVWVGLFALFSCFQCVVLLICSKQVCTKIEIQNNRCSSNVLNSISGWYLWNFFGAIFLLLPAISVIVNFTIQDYDKFTSYEYYYGFMLFTCIVHFCNFTQLNCWMRNLLSLVSAVAFIVITIIRHGCDGEQWFNDYRVEVTLDLILLLLLIWFLNREFEIGYRLTFYGSAVANQDKIRVQNMKNQADLLLHNIIPKHVAEQLKSTAKYSENHQNVGIIFASIVNFNELYDESYLGGKEYLRVLNELIGDFDELLSRDEFQCIEKIKTIGSTFMAASGLDKSFRGDNNEHIHAMMEFAKAMQEVVESFNQDLIEFNLILRIGYHVGDVTAGVIGTSKLYYDIWGDSVNVASRMDSTGVPGRIQVGKDSLQYLEMKYVFEPRGKVYVKGKDDMEVYLFVDRVPDGDGGGMAATE